MDKVRLITQSLVTTQSRQKSYANKHVWDVLFAIEMLGAVAYRLALPPNLLAVHPVFHVSILKGYHHDDSQVIQWNFIYLDQDLSFEEESIPMLDRKTRQLRSKHIDSVKV
ncbi:hypothetical protein MTR67_035156 [Solanum verrucosum]|uniref:Tf2-1-like SH3-like domain-containing protein n=1 Tax=Solanum verrucosum TaxID=315347 RepID=A0AAF0U9W4_SOLVR|nr:hypothetical protein MTR67_035156 [Solanum verrucosum]